MERNNTEFFDLNALIKRSDLDIRKIAAISRNLTAGAYFDMLSELMRSGSMFSSELLKLISRDGDRNTYKSITSAFSLLKSLGYDKHEVDFDCILDAYDRGQSRLSSVYAKKILDSFGVLYARIAGARISELPEDFDVDPHNVILKEWIDQQYMGATNQKPVILAVDDSPVILKSVSSLLSGDYKVYVLAKSAMVEKTLSQITPDLFLLDYNMPVINGFELIPVIRSFDEHKDTPIIFLTSDGTIDTLSGAVMLGACDFIAKPVQPDTLRTRIDKHIAKKPDKLETAS